MLPKMIVPKGKLKVWYTFGLSSKGGDYDNLVKCFQDVLSSVYGFNDNRIYQATIKKVDVKKGQEYIEFDIQKNED
jgi:Holliday junction resolvase RusA-like endonuclease